MNGNNILLDTNILLYLLSGDKTISNILQGKSIYISFITELELLAFSGISEDEKQKIESLLSDIVIIDINTQIKKETVKLRSQYKLKLPDAIIAATAMYLDIALFSADDDFTNVPDLNFLKYEV